MLKDIIDLDSRNLELLEHAKCANLVLGDLFQDHNWAGEKPTLEEAKHFSYDMERIATYISIANDYVYLIKEGLKQNELDIDTLFDKVKKSETEYKEIKDKSISQIESFKIPDQHDLTMAEAKEIINRNGNAKYESVHDAFKLGYLIAQQVYGEKVDL